MRTNHIGMKIISLVLIVTFTFTNSISYSGLSVLPPAKISADDSLLRPQSAVTVSDIETVLRDHRDGYGTFGSPDDITYRIDFSEDGIQSTVYSPQSTVNELDTGSVVEQASAYEPFEPAQTRTDVARAEALVGVRSELRADDADDDSRVGGVLLPVPKNAKNMRGRITWIASAVMFALVTFVVGFWLGERSMKPLVDQSNAEAAAAIASTRESIALTQKAVEELEVRGDLLDIVTELMKLTLDEISLDTSALEAILGLRPGDEVDSFQTTTRSATTTTSAPATSQIVKPATQPTTTSTAPKIIKIDSPEKAEIAVKILFNAFSALHGGKGGELKGHPLWGHLNAEVDNKGVSRIKVDSSELIWEELAKPDPTFKLKGKSIKGLSPDQKRVILELDGLLYAIGVNEKYKDVNLYLISSAEEAKAKGVLRLAVNERAEEGRLERADLKRFRREGIHTIMLAKPSSNAVDFVIIIGKDGEMKAKGTYRAREVLELVRADNFEELGYYPYGRPPVAFVLEHRVGDDIAERDIIFGNWRREPLPYNEKLYEDAFQRMKAMLVEKGAIAPQRDPTNPSKTISGFYFIPGYEMIAHESGQVGLEKVRLKSDGWGMVLEGPEATLEKNKEGRFVLEVFGDQLVVDRSELRAGEYEAVAASSPRISSVKIRLVLKSDGSPAAAQTALEAIGAIIGEQADVLLDGFRKEGEYLGFGKGPFKLNFRLTSSTQPYLPQRTFLVEVKAEDEDAPPDWLGEVRVTVERIAPEIRILQAEKFASTSTAEAIRDFAATFPAGEVVLLDETGDGMSDPELAALITEKRPAIVFVRSGTSAFKSPEFMAKARANGVRVIIRAGTGVNNINVDAATKNGISVARTRGAENSVASLALHFILMGLQVTKPRASAVSTSQADLLQILGVSGSEYVAAVQKSKKAWAEFWDAEQEKAIFPEWSESDLQRQVGSLDGEVIALDGFGPIPQRLAAQLKAIKERTGVSFEVIAWSRSFSTEPEKYKARLRELDVTAATSKEDLLRRATVLSTHLPGEADSYTVEDFASAENLTVVANTARIELVPLKVVAHLAARNIRFFGDVNITDEFNTLRLENPQHVFLVPHVAASTKNAAAGVKANTLPLIKAHVEALRGVTPATTFGLVKSDVPPITAFVEGRSELREGASRQSPATGAQVTSQEREFVDAHGGWQAQMKSEYGSRSRRAELRLTILQAAKKNVLSTEKAPGFRVLAGDVLVNGATDPLVRALGGLARGQLVQETAFRKEVGQAIRAVADLDEVFRSPDVGPDLRFQMMKRLDTQILKVADTLEAATFDVDGVTAYAHQAHMVRNRIIEFVRDKKQMLRMISEELKRDQEKLLGLTDGGNRLDHQHSLVADVFRATSRLYFLFDHLMNLITEYVEVGPDGYLISETMLVERRRAVSFLDNHLDQPSETLQPADELMAGVLERTNRFTSQWDKTDSPLLQVASLLRSGELFVTQQDQQLLWQARHSLPRATPMVPSREVLFTTFLVSPDDRYTYLITAGRAARVHELTEAVSELIEVTSQANDRARARVEAAGSSSAALPTGRLSTEVDDSAEELVAMIDQVYSSFPELATEVTQLSEMVNTKYGLTESQRAEFLRRINAIEDKLAERRSELRSAASATPSETLTVDQLNAIVDLAEEKLAAGRDLALRSLYEALASELKKSLSIKRLAWWLTGFTPVGGEYTPILAHDMNTEMRDRISSTTKIVNSIAVIGVEGAKTQFGSSYESFVDRTAVLLGRAELRENNRELGVVSLGSKVVDSRPNPQDLKLKIRSELRIAALWDLRGALGFSRKATEALNRVLARAVTSEGVNSPLAASRYLVTTPANLVPTSKAHLLLRGLGSNPQILANVFNLIRTADGHQQILLVDNKAIAKQVTALVSEKLNLNEKQLSVIFRVIPVKDAEALKQFLVSQPNLAAVEVYGLYRTADIGMYKQLVAALLRDPETNVTVVSQFFNSVRAFLDFRTLTERMTAKDATREQIEMSA